jgi:hypothetical protein
MQAPTATPMPPPTAGGVREPSMCSRHRAGTIMLQGARNSSCLLARAIGYKPQRTKNHVVDSRIASPAGWWREGQNPKQPRPKMDPPPSGRVYSAAQAHSGLSGLQPSPPKVRNSPKRRMGCCRRSRCDRMCRRRLSAKSAGFSPEKRQQLHAIPGLRTIAEFHASHQATQMLSSRRTLEAFSAFDAPRRH